MTSNINSSYPVEGSPTTQSVRDNFALAKSEIEALQNQTDSPYTAEQVYQMAYPQVVFEDTFQVSSYVPASFTGAQKAAVAGYVVNDAPAAPSGWQNGVALMGVAVAHANNSHAWGLNTLLTDSDKADVVSTGTGRLLHNEMDFNVTSPDTTVFGLSIAGASQSQPKAANGFIINPLGIDKRWTSGFVVAHNSCTFGITIGYATALSGPNLSSQPIVFYNTDASSVQQQTYLQALPNNELLLYGGGAVKPSFHCTGSVNVESSIRAGWGAAAWVELLNSGGLPVITTSSGPLYPTCAVAFQQNVGFYTTPPVAKQVVTGSRAGNVALQSVLTALAAYGLITNSSTA